MVFVLPTHPSVNGPPSDPGIVFPAEDATNCPREFYILSITDKKHYHEVESGRGPNDLQKELKGYEGVDFDEWMEQRGKSGACWEIPE